MNPGTMNPANLEESAPNRGRCTNTFEVYMHVSHM
jgi:hypothetical protein